MGGAVHDRVKVTEVLVDAVLLHDEATQPLPIKAAFELAHQSAVNWESEVPAGIVKLNGDWIGEGSGRVTQLPFVQHVTALL